MRTYSRIGKRIALATGFHFDTEEGDNLIPGFLDAIIGIGQGETKSFPLVFPESWKQDNLRGVHAQFTVSYFQLFPDIVHFFPLRVSSSIYLLFQRVEFIGFSKYSWLVDSTLQLDKLTVFLSIFIYLIVNL